MKHQNEIYKYVEYILPNAEIVSGEAKLIALLMTVEQSGGMTSKIGGEVSLEIPGEISPE